MCTRQWCISIHVVHHNAVCEYKSNASIQLGFGGGNSNSQLVEVRLRSKSVRGKCMSKLQYKHLQNHTGVITAKLQLNEM